MNREYLKSILHYHDDGYFIWVVEKSSRIEIGQRAGSLNKDGYRSIYIDGKRYMEHRLVWLWKI